MDNSFIFWSEIGIVIVIILIGILGGMLCLILYKNKKAQTELNNVQDENQENKQDTSRQQQGKVSINKFIEFDEIIDNMIVRKNRQQYVMVVKCKGVNYDLLSEDEKIAVEQGFTQFLNTLRFPIQLYIQTRSLNLKDIIDKYMLKVDGMKQEVENLDIKIKKAKSSGNIELQEKLEFDRRRKSNVLEYGADITEYIGRMSLNKNVLQQSTYVVVSYFTSEIGTEINNYSKQEIDGICFNELYIRTQALIRSLASAEVYGRILESEELAELLYFAYNRDDAEILQFKKALDAEYDRLYSTAPDIMKKKVDKLQKEVEEEAVALATESMLEADRIRLMQRRKKQMIKDRALEMIEEYREEMDKDLYFASKEQVNKYDTSNGDEDIKDENKKEDNNIKEDKEVISVEEIEKIKRNRKTKKKIEQ